MQTGSTIHLIQPNPTVDPKGALHEYLPMIRMLARRIHRGLPRNVEIDDLYAAGLVGLWEAYGKFDPSKNVRFATFAQFRIQGAILDSLRANDWAPRRLRSEGRTVKEAIRTLTSQLGRPPSEEEVAAGLKLGLHAYQQLLWNLDVLEIGTLHRPVDDGSGDEVLISIPDSKKEGPLDHCLRSEATGRMRVAIEDLPKRERLVVTLYYYEELTRHQISLALDISEIKVQQIRASAVRRLRTALLDVTNSAGKNLTMMRVGKRKSEHATKLGPAA
jgi:RNA polymerase sigma factor for flagellar operon FliA